MASPLDRPEFLQFRLQTTFGEGVVIHDTPDGREVWEIGDTIEYGGQGEVVLQSRNISGKELYRAVKEVRPGPGPRETYEQTVREELSAFVALHEYTDKFVTFFGWYQNATKDVTFIAMEYLRYGDLCEYMKKDPEYTRRHCREIVTQILKALELMHEKGFCHRDLKPGNVLVASTSPFRVKLTDFGIAKSTDPGTSPMESGGTSTRNYMAPEIHGYNNEHLRANNAYTEAVDMWALGALTHEIFTGVAPFFEASWQSTAWGSQIVYTSVSASQTASTNLNAGINPQLLSKFCEGSIPFPETNLTNASAPEALIEFIRKTIQFHPEERLTPSEALKHPWINSLQLPGSLVYLSFKYDAVFDEGLVTHTFNGYIQKWQKGLPLSTSQFSNVYREFSEVSGIRLFRAVKHRSGARSCMKEINVLIALKQHTTIFLEFYGWYEGPQRDVYIATEYISKGDLRAYMNKYPAQGFCKVMTAQILRALDVMHRMGICHRNLKPEHVLIASIRPFKVKLAGFGFAELTCDKDGMKVGVGTPEYMAPEVLGMLLQCRENAHTEVVDIWALGIITYEIFIGRTPFRLESHTDGGDGSNINYSMLIDYCNGKLTSSIWYSAPPTLIDFMSYVLQPNTTLRPSACRALRHPWFSEAPDYPLIQ